MPLFVLAHHAQSVLNVEGRVNGDPAVAGPLTLGIALIKAVALLVNVIGVIVPVIVVVIR